MGLEFGGGGGGGRWKRGTVRWEEMQIAMQWRIAVFVGRADRADFERFKGTKLREFRGFREGGSKSGGDDDPQSGWGGSSSDSEIHA